jgi:AraC family transcriptional regulator, regulatory protein of adaptative response / DNA-3-methyladenine glycosylase II
VREYDISMSMPPKTVCDRARQTKDARFDGLFFTGVRSTRIYCRPVCPAPTPKPQNIVYFASAAAAASAGYRPCLRCRPELSPEIQPGDESVQRALALIAAGLLEEGSVDTLAQRVGVSARHLRRLFIEKVGASPLQVYQVHRVLLAKQLLTETGLSVTQVALAAGFASIRRFNDAFHARCGVAPSDFRRRALPLANAGICLRLAYRPPFDFASSLAVLREHALIGIERVTMAAYERSVGSAGDAAWINVTADMTKPELLLRANGIEPEEIQPLVRRVRRLFDLDADLSAVHRVIRQDARLSASVARQPGLRIPGAWDGFELAVAATLASGAQTEQESMLQRLLDRHGTTADNAPKGLDRRFPDCHVLVQADLQTTIGAAPHSAYAIRRLATAIRDRRLDFGPGQRLDEFVERFIACTGMPHAIAHLVALRALGNPDAWPLEVSTYDGRSAVDLEMLSSTCRPWRSYAALHLDMLQTHEIRKRFEPHHALASPQVTLWSAMSKSGPLA